VALSFAQTQTAITYNQAHAMDVLPAIERELGQKPSPPGRGWWNVAAVECIATLQEAAGMVADGQFGPQSRLLLCKRLCGYASDGLWPAETRDEREHWAALSELAGYPLADGRHSLIGLRAIALDAEFTHPLANGPDYDDTFVWLDVDGSVRRFVGATHSYKVQSEPMRADDRTELATIRPGRYHVSKTHDFQGHPALEVFNLDGTNLIPAWLDHGRRLLTQTVSELPTRISQLNPHGAYTRGIMFHPGFDTMHSQGPFSSLGSQTAPLVEIERLSAAETFDYVLLDAVELLQRLNRPRLASG
jgi:hypothetical protein